MFGMEWNNRLLLVEDKHKFQKTQTRERERERERESYNLLILLS